MIIYTFVLVASAALQKKAYCMVELHFVVNYFVKVKKLGTL